MWSSDPCACLGDISSLPIRQMLLVCRLVRDSAGEVAPTFAVSGSLNIVSDAWACGVVARNLNSIHA